MIKNILLLNFLMLSIFAKAQTDTTKYFSGNSIEPDSVTSTIPEKEIEHYVSAVEVQSVFFLNLPDEIKQKFSTAISLYFQYKFPIVKTNFMIAAGLGVSNVSMNFNGVMLYTPNFDSTYIKPLNDSTYKQNRMNLSFIDMPVDIRFATNTNKHNEAWLFALGFSAGLKVNDFIKTTGEDINGNNTKVKTYYTKNLLSYHYGLRARIGYGNFCLSGYYNLTNLFENNAGPEINYYTIGLTLGGF